MSQDDISDEEKAFFRSQMRHVKPLKSTPVHEYVAPEKSAPVKKTKTIIPPTTPQPDLHYLSDFLRETVSGNSILSYKKNGLAEKKLKELASGKIPWQSRLDLHGKNREEASALLSGFITKNWMQHYRCVLIIHGKGEKNNNPPVLKNQINTWLPQFDEVLAFHSALPKDGGAGAVYVLLRRNRDALDK